jgi:hypothetical protein
MYIWEKTAVPSKQKGWVDLGGSLKVEVKKMTSAPAGIPTQIPRLSAP